MISKAQTPQFLAWLKGIYPEYRSYLQLWGRMGSQTAIRLEPGSFEHRYASDCLIQAIAKAEGRA